MNKFLTLFASWRFNFLVFFFYLLIAILITWPLVTNLSGQLIGHDTSDAYEMGHHIWWFKYALQTGQPLFYQSLLAYPDGIQGISLWSNPLQFFPAWAFAFIMPIAAAYNVTILLTMALNGWTMWWLMRYLLASANARRDDHSSKVTDVNFPSASPQAASVAGRSEVGSEVAPLLAGLIFMAFPTFQGHLFGGHAGLLMMWPVPLYIWALFRLVNAPSRRNFALSVLFFVLSPFGHTLQTIYVLMPLTGLFLLARLHQRDWHGALRVIGVGLVGGVLLLIFLLPVFRDTFATEAYSGEGFVEFSTDLLGLVTPSFLHAFFGRFTFTHDVLGVNLIEGFTYFGLAAAILSLIAVFKYRESRWWLLLAVAAWLLSLGPLVKALNQPVTLKIAETETYLALPWAWIYNLPGFSLARTPGRFTFTLALAVAVMAGYGAAVLMNGLSRWPKAARWGLTAFLMAFILWEYQAAWPYPTVPADVPQPVQALATRDDIRAVMDMPWGNLLAAKDGLYLQTWHQKPLIAGQVTRRTPVSPAKLTLLEETLDPALLRDAGVGVIIAHKTRADAEMLTRLRDHLGEPYYEDDRLALFDVPPTNDAPETIWRLPDGERFDDQANIYIYMSESGWLDLTGTLNANDRLVDLRLDNRPIQHWALQGASPLAVPVYLDTPGYYTLTFALNPPCPATFNPTLACRPLRINNLSLTPLESAEIEAVLPVQLGGGISLNAAYIPSELNSDGILPVRLAWQFAAPRSETDVRFIHVLDADGVQVGGHDTSPGTQQNNTDLMERIDLDLSNLLPGRYEIYAGWYTHPDLIRFPVMADTPRAQDGLIYLGAVEIP